MAAINSVATAAGGELVEPAGGELVEPAGGELVEPRAGPFQARHPPAGVRIDAGGSGPVAAPAHPHPAQPMPKMTQEAQQPYDETLMRIDERRRERGRCST